MFAFTFLTITSFPATHDASSCSELASASEMNTTTLSIGYYDNIKCHVLSLTGNSLVNNGNNNTICGDQLPIYTGQTKTFVCKQPIKGRYVNIHLPGYRRTLTLCEVEVIAKGTKSF